MPRRKTKAEDIRNPEHYFNRYIACEVKHHSKQQAEIRNNECSLEERTELCHPAELIFNTHGEQFDQVGSFLDTIENESLLDGLKSLTKEQLILVVLLYREQMSQQETADLMGITQQSIFDRLETIKRRLKKYF